MASNNSMTSGLKRKRGPLKALQPSKKSRSNQDVSQFSARLKSSKVDQEAAFETRLEQQIDPTNGVNRDEVRDNKTIDSSEAEEFQDAIDGVRSRKHNSKLIKMLPKTLSWKVSEPIGGRMTEIDPVFTADEEFLIVAHRKAIQVYSTSNSLLHRSINLSIEGRKKSLVKIIDYVLSPTDPDVLWVACSNGSLYKINWSSGEGSEKSWKTSSEVTARMTVASMNFSGQRRDIVFTSEKFGNGWRISANELSSLGDSTTTLSRIVYESDKRVQLLRAIDDGKIIIAASEEKVLFASLRSSDFGTVDQIRYRFQVFESADFVTCLDARISQRNSGTKLDKVKIVDVVVGGAKGAIFVHNDLLRNLNESQKSSPDQQYPISLIPRKLHWHRKSVQCVKWSLDGHYIISGGSETVLVLWQLDTGRQQYLPHLSATIQNIVVSPTGTSYALHLGDNSTMIISTSELIPTAYIAGIQAHVIGHSNLDSLVKRLGSKESGSMVISRTPTVINPIHPENLLLAVGEMQEIYPHSGGILSAPFLQTFNVAANHNISRQAMSRTNLTNKNVAPSAHAILEPAVTLLQISHDGVWLATIDEWIPPKHDIEVLGHNVTSLEQNQRQRREVHLKFWQWNKPNKTWDLVSRIDAPHTMAAETHGAGRVLSLVADPKSRAFSTLGEDGAVQVWNTRIRKRDGVIVRDGDGKPLHNWHCERRLSLGTMALDEDAAGNRERELTHGSLAYSEDGSMLAAAINGHEDGLVHLIDPVSGIIQSSRPLLYRGDLVSMAFSGQFLITLSDELRVYDLVLDELKYGIMLGDALRLLALRQKTEMFHLAVDSGSHTFAVALPSNKDKKGDQNNYNVSLTRPYSEIAVFDPRNPIPLHTQRLPTLVTAFLPAISSPGYLILDAAAEIRTISPKASQTLTSMARSMVDLRLDMTSDSQEAPDVDLIHALEVDAGIDMEEEEPLAGMEDNKYDDTDDGPPVVTVHQLSQALDIGPSFALPPIEELFYAVAGLLSNKPQRGALSEPVK